MSSRSDKEQASCPSVTARCGINREAAMEGEHIVSEYDLRSDRYKILTQKTTSVAMLAIEREMRKHSYSPRSRSVVMDVGSRGL